MLNAKRGDMVFCADAVCHKVQSDSGYTEYSTEGITPSAASPDTVPLYFSWSDVNEDNWVTNSSAMPGPTYKNFGNPDGFLWKSPVYVVCVPFFFL
jgi:hypothetical protein